MKSLASPHRHTSTALNKCRFTAHQCSIRLIMQPSQARTPVNISRFSVIALCITKVGLHRAFTVACHGFDCKVLSLTAHKNAGSCTTSQKIFRKQLILQNRIQKNLLNFVRYLMCMPSNMASIHCVIQGHRDTVISQCHIRWMEFRK